MPDNKRPGPPTLTRRERLAAPASASADESADVSATESASADVPEQFSVRVRPSTKRAIDAYTKQTRIKKGPTTDILWHMLIAGDIDLKTVRERVRALRDA